MAQLLEQREALGDVAHVQQDAVDQGIAQPVVGHELQVAVAALGAAQAHAEHRRVALLLDGVLQEGRKAVGIVGVHQVGQAAPDQRLGLVTQHAAHRLGQPAHARGPVDDRHDVGGVAHQGVQALLAAALDRARLLGQGPAALDAVQPPAQQRQQQHPDDERGDTADPRAQQGRLGALVLAMGRRGGGPLQALHGGTEDGERHAAPGTRVAPRDGQRVDPDPIGGAHGGLDLAHVAPRHPQRVQLAHAADDLLVGLQPVGQGRRRRRARRGQAAPGDEVDALGAVAHPLHQDLGLAGAVGLLARSVGQEQHPGDHRDGAGQQRKDAQRALLSRRFATARPESLGEAGSHVYRWIGCRAEALSQATARCGGGSARSGPDRDGVDARPDPEAREDRPAVKADRQVGQAQAIAVGDVAHDLLKVRRHGPSRWAAALEAR